MNVKLTDYSKPAIHLAQLKQLIWLPDLAASKLTLATKAGSLWFSCWQNHILIVSFKVSFFKTNLVVKYTF